MQSKVTKCDNCGRSKVGEDSIMRQADNWFTIAHYSTDSKVGYRHWDACSRVCALTIIDKKTA